MKRTRLLVRAEQGVGDQIMFISLIPDLLARAGRRRQVILECEARLVPFSARSFPGALVQAAIACHRERCRQSRLWLAEEGWRRQRVTLMGSLPRCLRKTLDAFPNENVFLSPIPENRRVEEYFCGAGVIPAHRHLLAQRQIGRASLGAICAAGHVGRVLARPAGRNCLLPI